MVAPLRHMACSEARMPTSYTPHPSHMITIPWREPLNRAHTPQGTTRRYYAQAFSLMPCRCIKVSTMAMLLGGLLATCSLRDDASVEAPIQTDKTRYKVLRTSDPLPAIELTIAMTYTNTTGDTVYLVGCHRPPKPVLEKYERGRWVTAFQQVEGACLSPPWAIAPDSSYRDTLQVRGYAPEGDQGPFFRVSVPGRYRLVMEVYRYYSEEENYQSWLASATMPLEDRVSNVFRIEE